MFLKFWPEQMWFYTQNWDSFSAEHNTFSFDLYLVLSYCQVWQIPAVLYQCYTDVIKLDTVTIEAFKPLLSSKILKSLVKVKFHI